MFVWTDGEKRAGWIDGGDTFAELVGLIRMTITYFNQQSNSSFIHRFRECKSAPSKRSSRFSLLAALTLALVSSGCESTQYADDACPSERGVTSRATDVAPGGVTAEKLRKGLSPNASPVIKLSRVHTQENTKIPEDRLPQEDGVVFDLIGAPAELGVTVEFVPLHEGLRYYPLLLGCGAEDCWKGFRCVSRSVVEVDLHIRAENDAFEAVIPVDLEYYPRKERVAYPGQAAGQDVVTEGRYVFFGKGRVDESKTRGSLGITKASTFRGQQIGSQGFGVRVELVDQKVVSIELLASFKNKQGASEGGWLGSASVIYSTHPSK